MSKKVVIIGSGVIGLFCAYYLSEEGHEVVVIDKNPEGSEANCSARNAGMLVPSHFIPLASPGIIAKGIRWMLDPKSPFYIRPQMDAALFSWLIRFWMSANKNHVHRSSAPLLDYNLYSLQLYKELEEKKLFDFEFKQQGLLMICKTANGLHEEAHTAEEAGRLGLKTEVMDRTRLKEFEPGIEIDAAGAVLFPGDGQLHPGLLMKGLLGYLKNRNNVFFVYDSPVKKINNTNGTISSVTAGSGSYSADEYIVAGGAYSSGLCRMTGIRLPMMAGKGYSLTTGKQKQDLRTPSILCEARVAVTSFDNEIRFGGTMELGGDPGKINPSRVEGIIDSVKRYFPSYDTKPLKEANPWAGLRPCAPDGLPYLGRFSRYNNLIAATGHSMMGLSLAPATGQMVSDLVMNRRTKSAISLYNPDRYK